MDSKIKAFTIWSFTICSFILSLSLTGCKENKWAEWKVQNEIWLDYNKGLAGVKVTDSGLQYKIVADPTPQDARPNTTSTVICDYKLYLINNYDAKEGPKGSPLEEGRAITLNLASTISGFAEGCHRIHNNGDIILYIPAYLGYDKTKYDSNEYYDAEGSGTEGTQSYIPPYSTLIYEIHLCGVTD